MSEWPSKKDDVYGILPGSKHNKLIWGIIGKGNKKEIVKNRSFICGPYLGKCGHWVMAYKIYKTNSCPVCDPEWESVS